MKTPINKIFFDLDECLIHASTSDKVDYEEVIVLNPWETYYIIVRENIQDVIDHARSVVGKDNVYILTTSITDYANAINEKIGFGFERDHIFTREDLTNFTNTNLLNVEKVVNKISNPNNILIDNLPYYNNKEKIDFIGIGGTKDDNYLMVPDFYGFDNEDVKGKMIEFIDSHSESA